MKIMKQGQIKSKERVAKCGEVFTAEREVKAMCDLVANECERIDSRFLEPACGNGNFLAEILARKLAVVKKKYRKSSIDYEKNSLLAVSSLYGVDIMQDNAEECRERLYNIWFAEYKKVCKNNLNDDVCSSIKAILKMNIVCGNALSLKEVDENGNDIDKPIVFSEWAFISGTSLQKKDYEFADLVSDNKTSKQNSLLNQQDDDNGKFLGQIVLDYRRVRCDE